jgi:hypothetical protein
MSEKNENITEPRKLIEEFEMSMRELVAQINRMLKKLCK